MKTTIFNLIILDESGSMRSFTDATISGCNETLNVARHKALENADAIHSLVSIYVFQSGGPESRYLVKNMQPATVKDITHEDYSPYGCTPLLDAVGSTLTELLAVAATHENATAVVTIMTDGFENSSTQYSAAQVSKIISQCRELGWTINLIGANIDVAALASQLNIAKSNSLKYKQTQKGSEEMWANFSANVSACYAEEAQYSREAISSGNPFDAEEARKSRKSRSGNFFKRK